jgi:hypothetical protein
VDICICVEVVHLVNDHVGSGEVLQFVGKQIEVNQRVAMQICQMVLLHVVCFGGFATLAVMFNFESMSFELETVAGLDSGGTCLWGSETDSSSKGRIVAENLAFFDLAEALELGDKLLFCNTPATVAKEDVWESSETVENSALERIGGLFQGLLPGVQAVEVSLEDVRVFIAEVHWLCRILCDPLRLTWSGEKLGPASEDVGMKREAFHISG